MEVFLAVPLFGLFQANARRKRPLTDTDIIRQDLKSIRTDMLALQRQVGDLQYALHAMVKMRQEAAGRKRQRLPTAPSNPSDPSQPI
ncbi:hypothetical protein H310_06398 [Aphanomyces invadans]|uniref:Uncharacterized protein n=1 Tax=Aphanomyces invadans TaxID=157072 RepID=A0A024U6C3_9STRA|nr:hypothetical protein H310_06398 [Aphanomyces invadans]ETW01824.1 hypothetical protein H310_06398 [Aphanomyces invadans]|eukprot:XP_008869672.1 hypothetical protein H310_06398 [Aphanomyces invadans]